MLLDAPMQVSFGGLDDIEKLLLEERYILELLLHMLFKWIYITVVIIAIERMKPP